MWLLHSTLILNNIQWSPFLCPRLSVTLLFLLPGQSAEITALIHHVHMRMCMCVYVHVRGVVSHKCVYFKILYAHVWSLSLFPKDAGAPVYVNPILVPVTSTFQHYLPTLPSNPDLSLWGGEEVILTCRQQSVGHDCSSATYKCLNGHWWQLFTPKGRPAEPPDPEGLWRLC